MQLSARSYLNAGISLTAATAIAFTPLVIPAPYRAVEIPTVTTSDIRLTATLADVEAFITNLQALIAHGTDAVTEVSGIPGRALIGLVDNIVTTIDVVFTGLIAAADDPTARQSLTILKTFSYDAFAMLAHNLGLINPVITTTTAHVGELVTDALTGSLQNILTAIVNLANDPLAFASYTGLFTAGVASGQLIANNGLRAIQAVGDGGFDIVGTAITEVTFQLNNAVARLGELATQLGDASGSAVVQAVIAAVRSVVIAPVLAVVNLGVAATHGVLAVANAGFDLALDGAANVVNAVGNGLQSTVAVAVPPPIDENADRGSDTTADLSVASVDTAVDPAITVVPVAPGESSAPTGDTLSVVETPGDEVGAGESTAGDESDESPAADEKFQDDADTEPAADEKTADKPADQGTAQDTATADAHPDHTDTTDSGGGSGDAE